MNAPNAGAYTFRWLLAWGVLLALLALANRTRIGHVTIYYLLVASLFLLLVTQYKWLANVLQPIQSFQLVAQTTGTAPGALASPQQVAANGG